MGGLEDIRIAAHIDFKNRQLIILDPEFWEDFTKSTGMVIPKNINIIQENFGSEPAPFSTHALQDDGRPELTKCGHTFSEKRDSSNKLNTNNKETTWPKKLSLIPQGVTEEEHCRNL